MALQFKSTLSIGPVLGYRGYDVGAAIASELYGPPKHHQSRRYPSLPADEATPLVSPQHGIKILAAGVAVGIAGSLLGGVLRRRPPPPKATRTFGSFAKRV